MALCHIPTEPKPGEWSIWADNPMEDHTFTFEYGDVDRDECLRYLKEVTNASSCRIWNFMLVQPDHWREINRRRD